MERGQYDNLNNEKEQLKGNFELEIKELQRQNENAIERLLNEFKTNLKEV